MPDRQHDALRHPERLVLRQVDEVARPLQPEALQPGGHGRRGLARQDRAAADRVGLVGLRGMGEQPPAAVLDRDRPQQLRLEVVDDVLEIRDPGKPTTGPPAARSSRPRRRPWPRSRGPAACARRRRRRPCSASMYARRSSALTLTFTTPSSTAPSRSSAGSPDAPCNTKGTGVAAAISASRSRSSRTGVGREAVHVADRHRERVDARALDERRRLRGVGHVAHLDVARRVLVAGERAELGLHPHAGGVRLLDHEPRQGDVVLEVLVRAVEHDRAVAERDAGLDLLQLRAVVQMHADGHRRRPRRGQRRGRERLTPDRPERARSGGQQHGQPRALRGEHDRARGLERVGGDRRDGACRRGRAGPCPSRACFSAPVPRRRRACLRRRRCRRTRRTACRSRRGRPRSGAARRSSRAGAVRAPRRGGCRARARPRRAT